jgi:hypothetical protein
LLLFVVIVVQERVPRVDAPAPRVPVVVILHPSKAPTPNVPVLIFPASTPNIVAFVMELAGRDTVPVAVRLLVLSALVTR